MTEPVHKNLRVKHGAGPPPVHRVSVRRHTMGFPNTCGDALRGGAYIHTRARAHAHTHAHRHTHLGQSQQGRLRHVARPQRERPGRKCSPSSSPFPDPLPLLWEVLFLSLGLLILSLSLSVLCFTQGNSHAAVLAHVARAPSSNDLQVGFPF